MRALVRDGIDVSKSRGLEIGPLDMPIVRKDEGDVFYIDRLNTAELKDEYAEHPNINKSNIAPIDFVWRVGGSLQTILSDNKEFDYAIASHVIEHVPNPIKWLSDIYAVLRPGGVLRLIIPDARFCFDYIRPLTCVTDLLSAHAQDRTQPTFDQVLESEYFHRSVAADALWSGRADHASPQASDFDRALQKAKLAQSGVYVDTHCWCFTPTTFERMMAKLYELSLMPFALDRTMHTVFGTGEFMMSLVKSSGEEARGSWGIVSAETDAQEGVAQSRRELDEIKRELSRLSRENNMIRSSRTWKTIRTIDHLKSYLIKRRS